MSSSTTRTHSTPPIEASPTKSSKARSSPTKSRNRYHHGDLRRSLIEAGLVLVQEVGVEAISLRELAERVGVSTPALYHHFKNKQQLLFVLGEASIDLFQIELDQVIERTAPDFSMEDFVLLYVRFAIENPELYELMFGRQMWSGEQSSEFHHKAKHSFRVNAERLAQVQQVGQLPSSVNPLRLAQVAWATLHGLCRMYNDGLAFAPETIEDIARYACRLMQQAVLADLTR